MNRNEIKDTVRKFITDNMDRGTKDLGNGESLFERGVVDSFGLLELIAFIEKTFGVSVSPSEVAIEVFDSIDKITNLIEDKKKKAGRL